MRSLTACLTQATLISFSLAAATANTDGSHLAKRAEPANQPYGYAPHTSRCPPDVPKIRDANSLSSQEISWLAERRASIRDPMKDLLWRADLTGFDVDKYIDGLSSEQLPVIAIALSGGGYRAMLTGAGVVSAFDSRTPGSTSEGQLGGLLQSSTYLSALSGGNWLVGSLYSNNFTSVHSIMAEDSSTDDHSDLWQFGTSILEGPQSNSIQFLSTAAYYADIIDNVAGKKRENFDVSVTDYYGRALSYQLVNASAGGPEYTFSSIAAQEWFQNGSTPLPLIVADGRRPGETLISTNSTVYTINPWEIGSQDPTLHAFAPLKYTGTHFTHGTPSSWHCVTGLDNVGFVMGTSASLFNSLLVSSDSIGSSGSFSGTLKKVISDIEKDIGPTNVDISNWSPNPFYHYSTGVNVNSLDQDLMLVDGGEDLQNIPFHPLIQSDRHVDVIFAVDSSGDTNSSFPTNGSTPNYPAGLSLMATYARSKSAMANGTSFPNVPDIDTFLNLGFNDKPTFFGCDFDNANNTSPLIVYLPNAPYTFESNLSTLNLSFSDTVRNDLVTNGYALATQLNGTLDSDWPACVSCAILSRSLERTGTSMPEICKSCFSWYCWNGNTDNSKIKDYVPVLKNSSQGSKSANGLSTEGTDPSASGSDKVAVVDSNGSNNSPTSGHENEPFPNGENVHIAPVFEEYWGSAILKWLLGSKNNQTAGDAHIAPHYKDIWNGVR